MSSIVDKDEAVNKTSLSLWVDREKFLPFMFITDSNINELAETGKRNKQIISKLS